MMYKMIVKISNPDTPEDMSSQIVLKLNAEFTFDPETYGNGHYLAIYSDDKAFLNVYDVRYDKSFRKNDKEGFLKSWANAYWTGTNGLYKIDELQIEKAA